MSFSLLDHTDISGRIDLISQALALCTSLTEVLDSIGPSRLTSHTSYCSAGEKQLIEEVHLKEAELHRRLQDLSEKRNTALSPISRVPDDILRYIFLAAHAASDNRVFALGPLLPRLLSRVCRRWRMVALDAANLWTYVRFSAPKHIPMSEDEPFHPWYGRRREDTIAPLYATNLVRSRRSLLHVDLQLYGSPASEWMVEHFLATCRDRVGDLVLNVHAGSQGAMGRIIPCISATGSVLRRLRLGLIFAPHHNDIRPVLDDILVLDLPSLQELELHCVPLPFDYKTTYTGFTTCRKLTIDLFRMGPSVSHQRLLALLQCCPHLEDLHMTVLTLDADVPPEPVHITRHSLPELRRLRISTAASPNVIAFECFKCPNLQHLEIDMLNRALTTEQRTRYAKSILDFLDVSEAPLRSFSAKSGIVACLDRLVLSLPLLEELTITFERSWTPTEEQEYVNLLNILGSPMPGTEDKYPEYPCPRLRSLASLAWAVPAHIRALRDLAQRRALSKFPIPKMKLSGWPGAWLMPQLSGMPATPQEAYDLESALAAELEELVIGDWRFDKDKMTWVKIGGDSTVPLE